MPSLCKCPIPCGKGYAIVRGRWIGPCGRSAVGLIPPKEWKSLSLLFDPIHTLADAFRCKQHTPGDVPFERFENTTLGHLRRYIVDKTDWKPYQLGRLWEGGA